MKNMFQTFKLYALAILVILNARLFNYMARFGLVLGANTLTNIIPTLYEALDIVSRELVGFIPAVSRDSSGARAALNETINIPVVPAVAAADITPGVTAPNTGDQVIGNQTMTIQKSRMVPVRWSGEETRGVMNSGLFPSVNAQRFQQAMRTLVNEVEADLGALFAQASRAYGSAGTIPFGTAGDLSDNAQVLKILQDNGAPQIDLHAVLGTSSIANIRGKQSVLYKVNESGSSDLLRRGIIGDLQGAMVHTSAAVQRPAVGTGASYTTTAAGFAVGTTSIPIITGTGTVLAGDVVTFAGDTNKYVVSTGVAAPGTIVLAEPGLRQAIPASATAMTIVAISAKDMYFDRSAIALVTRAPAMPEGGDQADDVIEIVDPLSGLAFQIAMYRQYRQVHYEVGLAWGVKAVTPRHIALLIG
mgnify:FL=1|jgi:hypothetical protein